MAESGAALVLMHSRGRSRDMYRDACYGDVGTEVARELQLEADEEALIWIAKEAEGSLRDAYTTFDQIASFTGDGRISVGAIRDTVGALSWTNSTRWGS